MQQPSSKVNDAENKENAIEEVDMAQQTSIEEVLPENTEAIRATNTSVKMFKPVPMVPLEATVVK